MAGTSEIFDMRRLYYYESGNIFTGSKGEFNFKIIPDTKEKKLSISTWHGIICSDLAEMDKQADFVLDESGFEEMINWLENEYKQFEKK